MQTLEKEVENTTVRRKRSDKNLENKSERKKGKGKIVLKTMLGIIITGMLIGLFLLYGPITKFREWYITSAMTTMTHQYLATWFYSDETINDVLMGECEIKDAICHPKHSKCDVVVSNINLSKLEIKTIDNPNREMLLSNAISSYRKKYDYIIMDCPPSLGVLTVNALTASDSVLIPVQCEYFALEGIMQLLNTITQARKNLNPKLEIEGVVLTMLDSRTNLGLEVVENVRGFFRERVYDTIIPRLIRLTEAPSHGKPIANYDPTSRGTEAYINLAKEVIARNE